jgi:hypothetical protein
MSRDWERPVARLTEEYDALGEQKTLTLPTGLDARKRGEIERGGF